MPNARTLLAALLLLASCEAQVPAPAPSPASRPVAERTHGMSVAHAYRGGGGYGSDACLQQFRELKALGVTHVSLSNFAWMESINAPALRFARDRTLGEGDTGKAIDQAHSVGLKVLLKPHTWARDFGRGKWHGDVAMTSDADWDTFFQNYTDFIVACAKVAEETKAESLCIGVEYVATTVPAHTARWRRLIVEVRKVYTGRLTYSAAFTEWKHIEFWNDLDVISISAYFPLTDKDLAPEADLRAGWARVYADLAALHRRTGKPILFSELGYTPAPKAGREPWSYDIEAVDDAYQARLFKVALEEAAKRDFVEGVYLWKWFTAPLTDARRFGREPFAIQAKPLVIEAIRQTWKRD